MPKPLKILALFDSPAPTTLDQDLRAELQTPDWKTEARVLATLRALGHIVAPLALHDDLDLLEQKLRRFTPDLIFNLVDHFKNNRGFDRNIAALLELRGIPFTGCGATGMTLCKHKALSKKILGYHGLLVPAFTVVTRGQRPVRPKSLNFPLIIKPLKEQASLGISRASFVTTDAQFGTRARFVHDSFDHDAIAEEYIAGRELYVGLIGNRRPTVFPIRELVFRDVPPGEPNIATFRAKWDQPYRQRWGLRNQFAKGLAPALVRHIEQLAKHIYGLLEIDGYARLDLRLTPNNEIYFLEANPNPMLAPDEDFARAARKAGLAYPQLLTRLIYLGLTAVRD